MSLFPNLALKQESPPPLQTFPIKEAKEIRLARVKQSRADRQRLLNNNVHGLPILNSESHLDIVDNKQVYIDDAPQYKATTNSKINFQPHPQVEFEVNLDIEALSQMFPSVSMESIYANYSLSGESLHGTIEILLAGPDSPMPDIQDTSSWPNLSQALEAGYEESNSGNAEDDCQTVLSECSSNSTDEDIYPDLILVHLLEENMGEKEEWVIIQSSEDGWDLTCDEANTSLIPLADVSSHTGGKSRSASYKAALLSECTL